MAKWCWSWREPLRELVLLALQPQAGTGNTPATLLLHTFSLAHLLSFHFPGFTPFPHVLPRLAGLTRVGGVGHPGIRCILRASFPLNPKVGQSWWIGKGDMILDVCPDVGSTMDWLFLLGIL